MKKLIAILFAALLLALPCVSLGRLEASDVSPIGQDISAVNAPHMIAGGNASTTDFLTAEDLAEYPLTVINVWSNECAPCVQEMPIFQRVHEEFHDRGVNVVGCCTLLLGGTYAGEWNILQNNGYTYTNVIQDEVLYNLYMLNSYIPQTFIVNSDGIVVDYIAGSTSYARLTQKLALLLHDLTDYTFDVEFVADVTGEVFAVQSVRIGEYPVYPEPPEIEGYRFMHWFPAEPPMVTGPTVIVASYAARRWTVRFYDSLTGQKIGTSFVLHGEAASAPEPPEHEGYAFAGWDTPFDQVTSDLNVNALYESVSALGDVDGSSVIDSLDALMALRYSLGIQELTPEQFARADVNCDGVVDSSDALRILRMALNIG